MGSGVSNGSNQFDNDLSGTAGQYGAGVNIQLTEHGSMHAEVDYQHGSHVGYANYGQRGVQN